MVHVSAERLPEARTVVTTAAPRAKPYIAITRTESRIEPVMSPTSGKMRADWYGMRVLRMNPKSRPHAKIAPPGPREQSQDPGVCLSEVNCGKRISLRSDRPATMREAAKRTASGVLELSGKILVIVNPRTPKAKPTAPALNTAPNA